MDTLKGHLEMFKRRQEQLKRDGGLSLKKLLDKANRRLLPPIHPQIYRKGCTR